MPIAKVLQAMAKLRLNPDRDPRRWRRDPRRWRRALGSEDTTRAPLIPVWNEPRIPARDHMPVVRTCCARCGTCCAQCGMTSLGAVGAAVGIPMDHFTPLITIRRVREVGYVVHTAVRGCTSQGGVNKSIIRCELMLKLGVFCIRLVIVMRKEA